MIPVDDIAAEWTRGSVKARVKAGPITIEKGSVKARVKAGPITIEKTFTVGHGGAAPLDQGQRFALCIVTDDYDDTDLQRLAFPSPDVAGLVAVLADPDVGCFSAPVELRNGRAADLAARIEEFFDDRAPQDVALVYLSGVVVADGGRAFFATKDTSYRRPGAASLGADFLVGEMRRCRSESIVVILDCAYTAASFTPGDSVPIAAMLQGRGRAVLTSSSILRRLTPASGPVSPTVLTDELVAVLRDNDIGHETLTVADLFEAAQKRVHDVSHSRSPQIADPSDAGRTIIAAHRLSKPASSWRVAVNETVRPPAAPPGRTTQPPNPSRPLVNTTPPPPPAPTAPPAYSSPPWERLAARGPFEPLQSPAAPPSWPPLDATPPNRLPSSPLPRVPAKVWRGGKSMAAMLATGTVLVTVIVIVIVTVVVIGGSRTTKRAATVTLIDRLQRFDMRASDLPSGFSRIYLGNGSSASDCRPTGGNGNVPISAAGISACRGLEFQQIYHDGDSTERLTAASVAVMFDNTVDATNALMSLKGHFADPSSYDTYGGLKIDSFQQTAAPALGADAVETVAESHDPDFPSAFTSLLWRSGNIVVIVGGAVDGWHVTINNVLKAAINIDGRAGTQP